jgi:hypothetical protein
MHRIDTPGHDANRFTEGNPFEGIPSTILGADFLNTIQEELVGVLTRAGMTPDKLKNDQVATAVQLLSAFGLAERAAISAPAALQAAVPMMSAGARGAIPLFDMPGLWICGNSRERPFTGTSVAGTGGIRAPIEIDGGAAMGALTISVRALGGRIEPAAGTTFRVGANATVYTVASTANFDHDAATCDVTFAPGLAVAALDGDPVKFRTLVDNGAGYALGVATIHVDGLVDDPPLTGQTFTVAGHATVYTVSSHTQFAAPSDADVTFTPPLTVGIADNLELTVVGAVDDNTAEANEYDTGRFPGEAWPYMAADAQTAHVANGGFPFCESNSGINCYRKGFLMPRRAAAGCFTLELDYSGDFNIQQTNLFLEWIVAPNFNPTVGFDFAGLHVPFQSSTIDTATQGLGTYPVRVRIFIEGGGRTQSGNLHTLVYTAHFLIGRKSSSAGGSGCRAPILSEWRGPVVRSIPVGTNNWRRKDTHVPVLWKYEHDSLLDLPGRRGPAVKANHNGSNLLRMSRTSARLWHGQH